MEGDSSSSTQLLATFILFEHSNNQSKDYIQKRKKKAWQKLFLQHGLNAVGMNVAEQYVTAFSNLAKTSNTVILPSNAGDVSSMVAQVRTDTYSL